MEYRLKRFLSSKLSSATKLKLKKGLKKTTFIFKVYYFFRGAYLIPCKIFFGNTSGIRNNVYGYISLNRARKIYPINDVRFSADVKESARLINDNGYLLLKSVLSAKEKGHLRDLCSNEFSSSKQNKPLSTCENIDVIEKIRDIAFSKHILSILNCYYECEYVFYYIRLYRTRHIGGINQNKDNIYNNTYHNDNQGICSRLRVFFLLSDCHRDSGAFRFHDRKTSEIWVKNGTFFHRNLLTKSAREKIYNAESEIYFEGNIGDCCIINPHHCLHAAGIPKQGLYRDMISFNMTPKGSKSLTKVNVPNLFLKQGQVKSV